MKNLCILMGRLGQNPKVTTFGDGTKASEFTLATTFTYKDRNTGEKREIMDWHRIKCYGNLARIVEMYLSKGSLILAQGMYKNETYTDGEGVKRRSYFLRMDEMKMLDTKKKEENELAPAGLGNLPPAPPAENNSEAGDDLPF